MQEKRRMPGRPVRRIVQKFCGDRIDFVHEIEYNKFELIFIYHSLYNLQDVSGKQKRTKRTAEQKNGDRGGHIMHLLYDENGNPIPHGAHDEHHHHHDHHHEGEDCGHACNACGSEEKCKDENLALLTYMLQHNEHHAAELDEMADKLEKAGMADAAKQIREGVSDFQKGNMRLSLALTLVKEHLKEVK